MKVSKHNVPNYYDRNRLFNDAAEGLVQDIFQHQDVGSTGYINSRRASRYQQKGGPTTNTENADQDEELKDVLAHYDTSDLGEYERRVFFRIVLGNYHTIVLRGDMGSGKSASINRIIETLRRPRKEVCGLCRQCTPVVIKLDFNKGFEDDELDKLMREFRRRLYHQLRQELLDLFRKTALINLLRDEVLKKSSPYAEFGPFIDNYQNKAAWEEIPKNQRVEKLFQYVHEETKHGTENISMLMNLVHLTKSGLSADAGCLVLIFDNIDSVEAKAQHEILGKILSYQATAQVQALVALRRGTYTDFESGNVSYTFGTIDHTGPNIEDIILARLKYYAENWDSLPRVQAISKPAYRRAVKLRLDYLLENWDHPRRPIQRVAAICGSSIRMGLFMSERFFLNSAVPYDEKPKYPDDVVRAVLVSDSPNNEIAPDDHCIANLLLQNPAGDASLLNIRILQLVSEFENEKFGRSVRNLLEMLQEIGGWDTEDCREAFNYLLYLRRPLLWADNKTKYADLGKREMEDVLHITEAGRAYLNELPLDLVYIQEAALSVRWKDRYLPISVDYSKVIERFGVLRRFLEILAKQDYDQTLNLMHWLSKSEFSIRISPILFVNRIIAALGRSVLHILNPRVGTGELSGLKIDAMNELRAWYSIIEVWLGTEEELLGKAHYRLEQLRKEYHEKVHIN